MNMFEIATPKLKKRVLKALDNIEDDAVLKKILHQMKGDIFGGNLKKALENSGIKDKFTSGHQKAYQWLSREIEHTEAPLEDKVHLVKLLADQSNLIKPEVFTSPTTGRSILDSLSPKIKNNKVFKDIIGPLIMFGMAGPTGMGPGEAAMIVLTAGAKENTDKKGGDFSIGDWKVEIKMGGAVPPGDSGQKVGDQEIKKLLDIAEKHGISEEEIGYKRGALNPSFERGWLPALFQAYAGKEGEDKSRELLGKYLKVIYPPIDDGLVSTVYAGLGQPGNNKVLMPLIYNMYKKSHMWDSMCFIDKDTLEYANTLEASDIPETAGVSYKLRQGGDTYAVASGAFMLYLKPDPNAEEGGDVPNIELNPPKKKNKKTKVDPRQQDLFDPVGLQKKADKVKQDLSIEQQRAEILKDPSNPITQAYSNIINSLPKDLDPAERTAELDLFLSTIGDGLINGLDPKAIAKTLMDQNIYESQLRRLKQLIA
jgi:hypothetical protein